ncbi:hypothetical protein [Streptomyces sp. S.PB5]|uniref:hypothetical protein n=1 Tax=Streptomyces sp. S.PB5 TaxID=3020844 RepID=UPI0025B0070E|nr:hypothetical protein [Streptomyces sp. S.PB5]MDN3024815.1 hypothetical protein [Streptomyces sp. S.PB5]
MTRPALRMCARCERTTEEPVLVHEVHAPTGPGFNVYACPECAVHYPPLTDALNVLDALNAPDVMESPQHRSRLTLRVYRLNAEGRVTEDRGSLEIIAGGRHEPVPRTSAYPPCACPRCRTPR